MVKTKLIARTATDALVLLWSQRFFEKWKNTAAVAQYLSDRHHHFSQPELGMAMLRAQRKYLLRRGTAGAYEYIQKFPYAEEGQNDKRRPK